jgi:hypothetical protein
MQVKPENIQLGDKIMSGIKKAVEKLVIESAERDEKLIIADKEGNVMHVPAKELLGQPSKKQ